ncbi:conserved Plasmodium protein, unknown function [Plasmodium chabaudi chabaudi]|uniref:Uncharacterized protein n=1 Tax=Plasmodium chabaudi chabaudi TaxID=31271 RepID=A0A4V0KE07_PLACU|nr:conserved Plasmodium protein, unknown function [Plasmodium chabaudi chabaudi]VTZ71098.1 conserved Plasmodium protein, unknown function [Plasmodium chabaudi chabaudi]|eukprot:XP_016654985.1 conserved Plasmodium protein, unknown function [Plasmodium chabaudi chabaudi]
MNQDNINLENENYTNEVTNTDQLNLGSKQNDGTNIELDNTKSNIYMNTQMISENNVINSLGNQIDGQYPENGGSNNNYPQAREDINFYNNNETQNGDIHNDQNKNVGEEGYSENFSKDDGVNNKTVNEKNKKSMSGEKEKILMRPTNTVLRNIVTKRSANIKNSIHNIFFSNVSAMTFDPCIDPINKSDDKSKKDSNLDSKFDFVNDFTKGDEHSENTAKDELNYIYKILNLGCAASQEDEQVEVTEKGEEIKRIKNEIVNLYNKKSDDEALTLEECLLNIQSDKNIIELLFYILKNHKIINKKYSQQYYYIKNDKMNSNILDYETVTNIHKEWRNVNNINNETQNYNLFNINQNNNEKMQNLNEYTKTNYSQGGFFSFFRNTNEVPSENLEKNMINQMENIGDDTNMDKALLSEIDNNYDEKNHTTNQGNTKDLYKCVSCEQVCMHVYYILKPNNIKNISYGVLDKCVWCSNCYSSSKYPNILNSSNFVKVNVPYSFSETQWTTYEIEKLIDGVCKYKNNWDQISQYVKTKTPYECIYKFISMPLSNPYFDIDNALNINNISFQSYKQNNTLLSLLSFICNYISPYIGAYAAKKIVDIILKKQKDFQLNQANNTENREQNENANTATSQDGAKLEQTANQEMVSSSIDNTQNDHENNQEGNNPGQVDTSNGITYKREQEENDLANGEQNNESQKGNKTVGDENMNVNNNGNNNAQPSTYILKEKDMQEIHNTIISASKKRAKQLADLEKHNIKKLLRELAIINTKKVKLKLKQYQYLQNYFEIQNQLMEKKLSHVENKDTGA